VQPLPSWRSVLGKIISDIQERQRIANELGISPVTLSRWVSKISDPRPQNIRRLLSALPHYRRALLESILQEFPDFVPITTEQMQDEKLDVIPSAFYARVLNAYTTTPKMQRSWSVTKLILQQALAQLDPEQVGMAVTVVQCVPPAKGGLVHSLRERTGYGTPPWHMNLEPYIIFLGAESLAGYAVGSCQPRIIQNQEEYHGLLPAHWVKWEQSAAAYPILRTGHVAGCLLVSCTEPNYFLPFRSKLIQEYANLLALMFDPGEYYALEQIQLAAMPYYRVQDPYIAGFRKQVSHMLTQQMREGQSISLAEAERLVWWQLEEQLILLPASVSEEAIQLDYLARSSVDGSK
jgi:transcriptional regulator with XRE-family HTH domain